MTLEDEIEQLRHAIGDLIALVRASGRCDPATLANAEVGLHWLMSSLSRALESAMDAGAHEGAVKMNR